MITSPTTLDEILSCEGFRLAMGDCIDIEGWKSFYECKKYIGSLYVSEQGHIGVVIHQDFRGQGYLKKFHETINRNILYADICESNIASEKAHIKLGFKKRFKESRMFIKINN